MNNTADLIFELGTEELPPVALKRLSLALEKEFISGLKEAGLTHGQVTSHATPRRLALIVEDCATRQPDRKLEKRGPAVQAAFDGEGNPTKAAEGFARSCGTSVDRLDRLRTDKGEWLMLQVEEKGKTAAELLPAIADQSLSRLPVPKRMRWGNSDAQFVRPVHWLLFKQGAKVVPCQLLEVKAGEISYGHRFHHPEPLFIESASSYSSILESTGKVITHFDTRRAKIKAQVEKVARTLGGTAGIDPALLDEVTALNEWPVAITGSFDENFLEVPAEALILTMKKNQKYFPLFNADGKLMNHFITIANIDSPKPDVISKGNERVIRPRLADAKFFWEQDGKKKLEDYIESLKGVVFQQKLGSMYDKSVRVAELAGWIAGQTGADVELAKRAAMLSRCDLMTNMVGEFADMQGIMGRYQALRDGEPVEISQAMEEFYLPRHSGGILPQTPTGIALALAEKIDTLCGIFGIGMKPTGDKDPFALRRAALGALRIIREHSLTLDIRNLLDVAQSLLEDKIGDEQPARAVYPFLMDRLKVLLADEGISVPLFESVIAVQPRTIPDLDARIQAVQSFMQLPEAEALAAANKRIRNILRKSKGNIPDSINSTWLQEAAEKSMVEQLQAMQDKVSPLLENADYETALKHLAELRVAVDRFFDEVMVMAKDEQLRNNRLALLRQLSDLFLQVADISQLQQ
jgi:glycyl-tRNA synthetase beta chain